MPITKDQIRLIKTVQTKHMSDEDYRDMLMERFKVSSCTQLTRRQAGKLIDLFVRWNWAYKPARPKAGKGSRKKKKSATRRRLPGNVVKMVSRAQKNKIAALAAMIDWRVKDGLTKWIAARFSIERVRTAQEAFQVIEGLKSMIERALSDQYGPTWYNLVFDEPAIQRFINEHTPSPKASARGSGQNDAAIYD
jgi:hypothetical protein